MEKAQVAKINRRQIRIECRTLKMIGWPSQNLQPQISKFHSIPQPCCHTYHPWLEWMVQPCSSLSDYQKANTSNSHLIEYCHNRHAKNRNHKSVETKQNKKARTITRLSQKLPSQQQKLATHHPKL